MSINSPAKGGLLYHARNVPASVLILLGILVLLGWAWGNIVQIQTSEAAILGQGALSLAPNFAIVQQIPDFFGGHLAPEMMIAATWGWGLEALLLLLSIGIEYSYINHKYAEFFWTGSIILVGINTLTDFLYSGIYLKHAGWLGQLGFAAMTLFMSFFFGLLAIHLIADGIRKWRASRANTAHA